MKKQNGKTLEGDVEQMNTMMKIRNKAKKNQNKKKTGENKIVMWS
jgi:hypothetical protein